MADFDLPDTMTMRPTRRPVIDGTEFRAAMAAMAASVSVVTAKRGDEQLGRTVTSLMSLSANPPTLLVSIDIMSRLADVVAKTARFSVAMLAQDQHAVADAFAGRGAADRFGTGVWQNWPSGQLLLTGAVSAFDCEVIGSIQTGTHVLFAGAIVEVETTTSREPLIWHRHKYHEVCRPD
jgi:flavin reductase